MYPTKATQVRTATNSNLSLVISSNPSPIIQIKYTYFVPMLRILNWHYPDINYLLIKSF